MIKEIKEIDKEVEEAHKDQPDHVMVLLRSQAIGRRFPTLPNRRKVTQLLGQEDRLRQFVHERCLSADLTSPGKRNKQGVAQEFRKNRDNQKKGLGYRVCGAGRKNKFLMFWQQVKIWHTCERLQGAQIDAEDIWMKFRGAASLAVKLLQHFHDEKLDSRHGDG